MPRRREVRLQLHQVFDAALLVAVLWLCHQGRYWAPYFLSSFDLPKIAPFDELLWLIVVIMPFGPLILDLNGYYKFPLRKSFSSVTKEVAMTMIWLALIIGGCVMFLRLPVDSRAVLLLFFFFGSIALIIKDRVVAWHLRKRAISGKYREPVLLAGTPEEMEQLVQSLPDELLSEVRIVGRIDLENEPIEKLISMMHQQTVTRVLIAAGRAHMDRVQETIGACETEGVEAWLLADFLKTNIARPVFDALGHRPMLVFRTTADAAWELFFKDMIDRIGALIGLILLSPLFLAVAIIIRFTSPGPIVFKQLRGGRHGRPFTMYKFRSMRIDAEERRKELESLNQMSGPVFKIDKDPRITAFGKWLRKTSIDEFPQLFNVLKGEMSLVGPRPLPLYEVEKFEKTEHRRRLSVKPGLTCLWQISGRNEVKEFEDWVKLDLEYIDNWSLWLDFKILILTVPVVVFGFGAK